MEKLYTVSINEINKEDHYALNNIGDWIWKMGLPHNSNCMNLENYNLVFKKHTNSHPLI